MIGYEVDQVYGYLKGKYGEKVKFVDKKENIEEPIFIIDL